MRGPPKTTSRETPQERPNYDPPQNGHTKSVEVPSCGWCRANVVFWARRGVGGQWVGAADRPGRAGPRRDLAGAAATAGESRHGSLPAGPLCCGRPAGSASLRSATSSSRTRRRTGARPPAPSRHAMHQNRPQISIPPSMLASRVARINTWWGQAAAYLFSAALEVCCRLSNPQPTLLTPHSSLTGCSSLCCTGPCARSRSCLHTLLGSIFTES